MPPDEIFSRIARRRARARIDAAASDDRWIVARMAEELRGRLDAVKRAFGNALVIGPPGLVDTLRPRGARNVTCDAGLSGVDVRCDEDRLPFADASFDLIISLGVLDSVNDVPGALLLTRRILRPGGLFLGAIMGAGSLATMRQCFASASGRFHPQIDVRAAGDLLGRAGFAIPVADQDVVNVRYATLGRLLNDLRANGLGNSLAHRVPLSRASLAEAEVRFADHAIDGKTAETLAIVYLTGWAPEASSRASGAISG